MNEVRQSYEHFSSMGSDPMETLETLGSDPMETPLGQKRMELTVESGRKIRNMSFLCALLVVCQHTPIAPWCGMHIYILIRIAVPFFFCVSGYFMTLHLDSGEWYRQALVKRVKTLLVPYLIFTVIWAAVELPVSGKLSWLDVLVALGLSPMHWPIVGALWYICGLFLYMLLLPLLLPLLQQSRQSACLTLGCLAVLSCLALHLAYTTVDPRLSAFLRWGFSMMGLFWFSFGIAIRRWQSEVCVPRHLMLVGAGISLIWYCLSAPSLDTWAGVAFYPITTALVMFAFWHLMPSGKWPALLIANTFPLYLMHWQVGHGLSWLFRSFIGAPSFGMCLFLWFMTVVVCISTAQLVRMLAPRFAVIAFGGR